MKKTNKAFDKLKKYGSDILHSDGMCAEKSFIQHSSVSCYEHSVNVAQKSLRVAKFLKRFSIKVNEKSLVRGALLHDYFLYDWHEKQHGLHGFKHAKRALKNAETDFKLNDIEKNIIKRHMFPLNICPPKYRESWIVCLADKLSALDEVFLGYRHSLVRVYASFMISFNFIIKFFHK